VLLAALAALAAGWVTILLTAPAMPAPAGAAVYLVGAFICHQLPERSFHLDGYQLPVCARCLGIYAGAAVVACAGCLSRVRAPLARWPAARLRRIAIAAAAPTAVTVAAEWSGMWAASNVTRAIAGLALGAAAALVVVGAVATLHYAECRPPRRPSIPPSSPV
jgi:uncharacterized membrane protein